MEFDATDLEEVVGAVWSGMLGVPMVASQQLDSSGGAEDPLQFTGCIHISAGWEGSLLVQAPEPVARELAAAMFGIEADDLGDEELVDALGEVTNMIGGNVKALVGGNVLSLPSVTRGRDFHVAVPGSRVCASTRVESCGQTSHVLLLARDAAA